MTLAAFLLLALLVIAAAAFVCWPVLRGANEGFRPWLLLASAAATLVIGIGAGMYLMLGSPYLAARTLAGPSDHDLRGLIADLAERVRQRPGDPRGWILLGRGYLTLGDSANAAAAFRRGIPVATPAQRPELYSAYGEALVLANDGVVPADAEGAFNSALLQNPKDFAARYYLGLAYANRRDTQHALALWTGLLADAPANAPWRGELLDRIALLTGKNGGAPDIGAMVSSLAARLKAQPDDAEGWQRLIRAYAVLGDSGKAHAALNDARRALKNDSAGTARLALEARELKLEK